MDKQAITQTEVLEDRVRIHFHLLKPDGIPNFDGIRDVLYRDIPHLPNEPKIPEDQGPALKRTEYWAEYVIIDKVGKTIAYHFTEWQENSRCREQDFEGGPYLRNKS